MLYNVCIVAKIQEMHPFEHLGNEIKMTSVGGKVIRFKVKVKRNASYQGDKYLL